MDKHKHIGDSIMELEEQNRETVLAEEREQLREEFRNEELEYNPKLADDEQTLKKAVDDRMDEYIDKHGDIR